MKGSPQHRRRNALASLQTNLELLRELLDDPAASAATRETAQEAVRHALRAAQELGNSEPEAPDCLAAPPNDATLHALRASQMQLQEIAEHCRSVIWLSKADFSGLLYLNPAFERVWGRPVREALDHPERWLEWVHEEDRDRMLAEFMTKANDTDLDYRIVRPDGSVRWVHARIAPVRCCPDTTCCVVGVIDDVTEQVVAARKESEALAKLEQSVREKQMLLNEVHHRVKNNLQIVSSLLYLQSRFVEDPASRARLLESRDRVCSMGLIHELLYECDDVSRIDFERYLDRLINALREAWVPDGRVIVVPRVNSIRLDLNVAVPCGLMVNEVLTNAFRHAFPDGRSGTVCVDLAARDGRVELVVRDDGVGFPPDRAGAAPKSLGLQLLRSLTDQLGGVLQIESEAGTTVRVAFPAA